MQKGRLLKVPKSVFTLFEIAQKRWRFTCAQPFLRPDILNWYFTLSHWNDVSSCSIQSTELFFFFFKLAEHQLILRNWSRVVRQQKRLSHKGRVNRAEGKSSLSTVTAVCWGYWTSATQRWLEVYLNKRKKTRQQKDPFLGSVEKRSAGGLVCLLLLTNLFLFFSSTFAGS